MCIGVKGNVQGGIQHPYNRPACCRGGEVQTGVRHPCTRPGCCRQVVRKEVTGCLTYWQHLPVVSRTLLLAVFEISPTCHVSDTFACLKSLRMLPTCHVSDTLLAVSEMLPTCHVSDNFCSCSLERTRTGWHTETSRKRKEQARDRPQ
jgi:hypothetical protein